MFDSHANSGIFQHIDIFMKHFSWAVDMSNHKYFVKTAKILSNSSCQFSFPVRYNIMISESMDTSSQNQQTSIDRGSLIDIVAGFYKSLTPSQIDYSHWNWRTLDLENGMGTGTCAVGTGVCLAAIAGVELDQRWNWGLVYFLGFVVCELIGAVTLFWEELFLVLEGVELIIVSLDGSNRYPFFREFSEGAL